MCEWEEPLQRPKPNTRVKGMNERRRQKPVHSTGLCAVDMCLGQWALGWRSHLPRLGPNMCRQLQWPFM